MIICRYLVIICYYLNN